jgi:TonB family protein
MNLLLDHLWQSTALLAVIGLLTLFFRNNGAHVRYALWLAASLKFLVPFAALAALGEYISGQLSSPLPAPFAIETLEAVAQPFSVARNDIPWLPLIAAIWAVGALAVVGFWSARWRSLQANVRGAGDMKIAAPMPVLTSPTMLEPGLVGFFRPVLLLPEGIAEKLSAGELQAIIAHEACHMRRRDNLTAALHMLAEALFWFWPPVWWLGVRLLLERERACDEAVVADGNDPEVYAESILKVCKFYVQSPLVCAAGVSGADLRKRMEEIMRDTIAARLSLPKKVLLLASGTVLLMLPLAGGLLTSPVSLRAAVAQSAAVCKAVPGNQARTHTKPPVLEMMLPGERLVTEMVVTVGPDGSVRRIVPIRGSGSAQADERAMAHVRQYWRWEPTGCGDAMAPVRIIQERLRLLQPTSADGTLPTQMPNAQTAQDAACRIPEPVANTHTLPPYPEVSRNAGETGTVEVFATVAAEGRASNVTVTRSSGFASLDEAATRHVRENWIWKPFSCRPSMLAPIRIVFNLP